MNKESLNFKTNYFLFLMISFLCLSLITFSFFLRDISKKTEKINKIDIVLLQNKNELINETHNLYYLLNHPEENFQEAEENIINSLKKISEKGAYFLEKYPEETPVLSLNSKIKLLNDYSLNYLNNIKENDYLKNNSLEIINNIIMVDIQNIINIDFSSIDSFNLNFEIFLKTVKLSYFIFIFSLLLVLFFIILHTIYLNKHILKNLFTLKNKILEINSGKHSILNPININSKDEIGEVANSFNQFENKIYEIIVKIKKGAFSIQQSAEVLNTYNDNIVRKSDEQKNKIELINSNLSRVKKTINNNNQNTLKLNQLTKKTKKITEIINIEAKNLKDTIETIFQSSEEIEKISTLIEELSFQTTILSLNSAVESTRIQKGSKSFDVISNEIHRLSTMGKQAAKDIKNLSNENKIKIDESTFYLENTVKLIETIVIKINDISFLLDNITEASKIETMEVADIFSSLKDIEVLSSHTNSIARDTLNLGEQLNEEALNFLDVVSFFDKAVISSENETNEENIDNLLSEEEKEKILMAFQKEKKGEINSEIDDFSEEKELEEEDNLD